MTGSLVRDGVCVLLGSVLTLAVVFSVRGALQDAVAQGGGGDVPIGNGDVNGDGRIDVSDGIWVINHVFRGGPEPVPIECPPPSGGGLPATGLTKCYDKGIPAEEIPCDSADFPGQDGFYQLGCPREGRFIDHGDGTVTDNCTGLMWQKRTADVNGDGTIWDTDRLTWQNALKYCDSLSFAGHDDWRLPNVQELQSIVDYGRFDPAIDPVFVGVPEYHWSSTSDSLYPFFAWLVHFFSGSLDNGSNAGGKDYGYFVRAVRGGL